MNDRVNLLPLVAALEPCSQGIGTVTEHGAHGLLVQTDAGTVPMRVAASCLLQPAAGDTVHWCGDARACWVTGVLEVASANAPATLRLPDDATLRAGTLRVVFERAELVGACCDAVVSALKWVGDSVHAVLDHVTTVAKSRRAFTEGSDALHAGTIELQARALASVHAEHVLVQGERLVKTRAAQIHMG